MSQKFHINKHGVPAPCRATKGNCPLGGDSGNENHFDTQEEAQEYADKKNSAKYGYLPGVEPVAKTDDGVEMKEGDTVYTFKRDGEEFIYSDYIEAVDHANELDDDAEFYERYAHATGNAEHVEPETVKVTSGVIAHLNKVDFEPKELLTKDGKKLSKGDDVYSYIRGGKRVYYADQDVAIKDFEADKEKGLIHNNPFNNPNKKETVNANKLHNYKPEYKDGNKSYAISSEINDRLSKEPINKDNVGRVMNKSLEDGSYNVNFSPDESNSMDVNITKVRNGEYVAKGKFLEVDSRGTTYSKETGYVSFNGKELENAIGDKANSSPADLFSGINKIVRNKSKL